MFKHIQSKSDISILINDDGSLYVICDKAKKFWVGKLEPVEWPENAVTPNENVFRPLRELAISDRSFLEDTGVNSNLINNLLKDI